MRFCRWNPASRSPQDAGGHRGVQRWDTFFLRNFWITQHGPQFVEHLPPLVQTSLDLCFCGARSVQETTEDHQNLHPGEFHSFAQGDAGGVRFCRTTRQDFQAALVETQAFSPEDFRDFLRSSRYLDGGAGDKEDVVSPHQNFERFPFRSPGHCWSPATRRCSWASLSHAHVQTERSTPCETQTRST